MKHFWHGFQNKQASQVQFKRHVILLYWSKESPCDELRSNIKRLSSRFPSVKVKVINVDKDPTKPLKHQVLSFPTVLLLKDGREVDRLADGTSPSLLEQLFRRAHT